ncbi:hypothetical protein KUTeg_004032 [Tegillarca granosa]|uniref:Uncharacterized protein n=1 Tax=Tegillarca granosa TaxID=220873 RepID=A0ABQ9FRZ7_TEGGR|nr:hypothetical protein KUTeg_004032 [Tegillarca granosa]
MPTWFCSRDVYKNVGGFDEGGKGVPEDLIFFYKHLELGGSLLKVEADLLMDTIWKIRLEFLQKQILSKWSNFTIWNAGKQGRKFYRSLSKENQNKLDFEEKNPSEDFFIHFNIGLVIKDVKLKYRDDCMSVQEPDQKGINVDDLIFNTCHLYSATSISSLYYKIFTKLHKLAIFLRDYDQITECMRDLKDLDLF